MIRINLLPVRALKKKESMRQTLSILGLSLGLVVLVILFFHLSLANKINQVETQIAAYNEEIRKLKIDTKDVEKFVYEDIYCKF